MNKFLVIRFEFCKSFYYSLISCKNKSEGTEYRITVMNGDIEKQLCTNNTIKEIKGCLQIELSSDKSQNQIKMEVAKALGKLIGKPVMEVGTPEQRLNTNDHPGEHYIETISENNAWLTRN